MRRFVGYSLLAMATVVGVLGLAFALFAGGYEGDALRASGLVLLAFGAVGALVGVAILRSGR